MLEQINTERRTLTDRVVKDIQETLIRSVPLPDMLCVSGPWPAGVLGILAGRLAEEIGRPAVVIGVGETTCVASVRGNRTVNVVDLVAEIASSLTKFGGHAEAAGFSFPLAALPDVERYFATLKFSASSPPQAPLPIDCPLKPGLVTSDVARQLRVLEPHGEGNECPVFVVEDLHVADVRPISSTGEQQRFFLSHPSLHGETVAAVAFRWNGRPVPGRGDRIDVATEVWVDRYHHREQVDLHLRDLQTHEESKEANAGVSWSRKAHGRGAP
jgi:single-stranded-DNA-specific exonuclease